MDTLVLNSDGAPLSVLPLSAVRWQKAIHRMLLDRVIVLEWYDDWIVRSSSWETRVPAVIMVKEYVRKNTKPNFNRGNIALRDRYRCQYCEITLEKSEVTLDHVIPVAKGGKTAWDNIVAACQTCNHSKGDRLIKPNRAPYQPSYYELVAIHRELNDVKINHPSWDAYL